MPTERTTVFFHIPKTAGSTITATLEALTPPEAQFLTGRNGCTHVVDSLNFASLTAEAKRRYRYVAGHLEMPVLESLPREKFVFTFLRSPVARCVSLFEFIRRTPTHHMHNMVSSGMSIVEFVAKTTWDEVRNGMTRRLSGIINQTIPTYDTALLKRAMFNLAAQFDFVGIQESFDKSLLVLGRMLGITMDLLLYQRRNRNPEGNSKAKMDRWALEQLLAYNRMDLELYEFGRQRFMELLHAQGPGLERELKDFKKRLKSQGGAEPALDQAA